MMVPIVTTTPASIPLIHAVSSLPLQIEYIRLISLALMSLPLDRKDRCQCIFDVA
jgi:hypothetical protein